MIYNIISMSRVIVRRSSYDYEVLRPLVFELLDTLDDDHRIQKNSRVLIKPNFLAPAPPEKAMLTHPLIIRAVAEYALEKGALVQVSDSPAMGTFDRIIKESGIQQALKGLNVELKEFQDSVRKDIGPPFHTIEMARDALNADVVLNLPKLKTHTQMLLTLGVKNLFGCIVGLRKPEWHFRTGIDRDMFARLLVKVFQSVNPSITILDGILAMEGDGPGKSGTPRHLGIIMASRDAVALDSTVCTMLGIHPDVLLTTKAARDSHPVETSLEIEGALPVLHDFILPDMIPLVFGPERLHGYMRRHLVQKPVADDDICRMCGECWKYCPAGAIKAEKKNLRFDYDKCIRCYCCIEVCPHGALRAKEPFIGRLVRRIYRK
jgi:uncharacterized protein (DUF362 family)/ferredoxin